MTIYTSLRRRALLIKLNMKAGDIFEHPVKYTETTVKLIAVESDICTGCIFKDGRCESDDIGIRQRNITGSCSIDNVIYQLYEDNKLKSKKK